MKGVKACEALTEGRSFPAQESRDVQLQGSKKRSLAEELKVSLRGYGFSSQVVTEWIYLNLFNHFPMMESPLLPPIPAVKIFEHRAFLSLGFLPQDKVPEVGSMGKGFTNI